MSVELVGANPIATLMVGSERHGVLSMWDVAWSVQGHGRAVLTWTTNDDAVRLYSPDPELGSWLATTFNRYFPEFAGLPPIGQPVDCTFTAWELGQDRAHFEVAASDGPTVVGSISKPLQTRPGYDPAMRLGPAQWALTNLLTFCDHAVLEVDGKPVAGRPSTGTTDGKVHSTAFIATHETWVRHPETRH